MHEDLYPALPVEGNAHPFVNTAAGDLPGPYKMPIRIQFADKKVIGPGVAEIGCGRTWIKVDGTAKTTGNIYIALFVHRHGIAFRASRPGESAGPNEAAIGIQLADEHPFGVDGGIHVKSVAGGGVGIKINLFIELSASVNMAFFIRDNA